MLNTCIQTMMQSHLARRRDLLLQLKEDLPPLAYSLLWAQLQQEEAELLWLCERSPAPDSGYTYSWNNNA